ncbi:hypothetical protein Tco_0992863 [Tanacetum coccineum]|uniref:Uncharacterized protein n=1 Tax=Tanacetum coccineum TaxID=301880 RepID=A0ABQ5F3U4_9ASTR
MDDPNITMEEYIRLEEEKARRRGKVYNWKTPTYGKIWDNEDVSQKNDFRISFDDSDDEPTIEEGEVIDTPIKEMVKTRNDDDRSPSELRIILVLATSIGRFMSMFYNSIMKDNLEFKGKSVVEAFMNAPIFVGTFSIVTDFAVIEDMDHYRDEEMGDVIVGKEFCKEIRVKAKRFEGMITIYNGNDEMTYQMARSHPSTVYTAYSLNEYSVYDTGINTAYPGDLAKKKSTKLVKYLQSGNLEVLES